MPGSSIRTRSFPREWRSRVHRARRFVAQLVLVCLAIAAAACDAAADTLFFKNGDRLTGQIIRLEGGRLTLKSALAGEITVNLSDLESFKSDQPLDVRLQDGSAVRAPVSDAPGGEVTVAPNTPQARTLPVAGLKAINPKDG